MNSKLELAEDSFAVGVDIGGTHTDLMLESPQGLIRSKAFTTHDNYSVGILNALTIAAEQLDLTTEDVLTNCRAFVNGTTIVTNVLTELKGAKVGVLITKGFRDTFRIARGARPAEYDDHLAQEAPPDVVARDCIEEIEERVDNEGRIVVALSEDDVRVATRRLRDKGVEAIAICYLWSFAEPHNERRTAEIVAEEFPEAFVTLSSEIHPVIREYERFLTAVFNCMSHRATTRYTEALQAELEIQGFKGALTFFQGIGGSVGLDVVDKEPITLLASGPAGGVMAARHLAELLDVDDLIVGDMGGTTFDTSVLIDRQPSIANRAVFGELETGINIIDIVSVGAGGGSLVGLDARGVPRVGPESAGSMPGPACYGRGGTRPTITDAMVAVGLIDPGNYLKGRFKLDAEASKAALDDAVGKPLGWSTETVAAGVHDLAVINMANAMREVTVERGHDPRDFTLFAYGGMLPLFAVQIGQALGCKRVIVPDNSPVFSAYGVLIADYIRQYNRTVRWTLDDPSRLDEVNALGVEMVNEAIADAEAGGINPDELIIERNADLRFQGQTYEVNVPLENRDLSPTDLADLNQRFPDIYERSYGKGTAWKNTPVVMLNLVVKATHRRERPPRRLMLETPTSDAPKPDRERDVFLPDVREFATIPVFLESALSPGKHVEGPCIVDVGDTTVYVPRGAVAKRDYLFNFTIDILATEHP